jgi:hypothetical protein
MKHSDGPWTVLQTKGTERAITRIVDAEEEQIAVIEMTAAFATKQDVTNAVSSNASLIAAAPELLDQCIQALKFCRREGIDSTWECALEKVIAKARGNL